MHYIYTNQHIMQIKNLNKKQFTHHISNKNIRYTIHYTNIIQSIIYLKLKTNANTKINYTNQHRIPDHHKKTSAP